MLLYSLDVALPYRVDRTNSLDSLLGKILTVGEALLAVILIIAAFSLCFFFSTVSPCLQTFIK